MINVTDKSCFISGPMTGIDNYNVGAFADAHATLKQLDAAEIYDPALEWLVGPMGESEEPEYCMRRCIHELSRYRVSGEPCYDYLVQLPGWENSAGAFTEYEVARACGIAVVGIEEVGGE